MDGQTVAAIIAAAISLLAMAVAFWQGMSARNSADTARKQAESSQRAADAAESSAESAKAGEAARQRAQDEAEGPEFQGLLAIMYEESTSVEVTVTMLAGPPLKQIKVSAVGATSGVAHPESVITPSASHIVWDNMREADKRAVVVGFDEHLLHTEITVHLDCTEDGERERKWRRSYRLADMHEFGRS